MSEASAKPPPDLRLRAKPPAVLRLSRRALLLLAGASAAVVFAALGFAFRPEARKAAEPVPFSVGARPPEAVRTLPADYRGPRLGPPLPGDLGRPIVAGGAQDSEALATPSRRDAHVERARQALEASRRSRLFLAGEGASPAQTLPPLPHPPAPRAGSPDMAEDEVLNPARLAAPASPNILQAGAVISAALVTGIRSDLPGQVVAQVTQPVYDTPTGRILLVPQGARLVGVYEDRVAFGQSRILLSWTRLILPNGRSLQLGKAAAGDAQGYSGLQDRVNRHRGRLFGMAALSTLLAAGAELAADDEDDLARAIRRGGVDTFNQAGQQAVGQALSAAPTITIRPGSIVRMIVTRDLVLEPYSEVRHG